MSAPVLSSISPSSGSPGTTITLLGSGFDPAAQVGCPSLQPAVWVSGTELQAVVPDDLAGPAGTSLMVAVFVFHPDGAASTSQVFTVVFPAEQQQGWTTVDAVAKEISNFERGGAIDDGMIRRWILAAAQMIAGAMLQRGLSLDPATWQQPSATADPSAAAMLETINRTGAAARLATEIASQFGTGDSALAKQLRTEFKLQIDSLRAGDFDKLFRPAAATMESGPLLSAGDVTGDDGCSTSAFTKQQVF